MFSKKFTFVKLNYQTICRQYKFDIGSFSPTQKFARQKIDGRELEAILISVMCTTIFFFENLSLDSRVINGESKNHSYKTLGSCDRAS
jgi:hypothetical protein